jgi:hypothetical protein
MDLIVRPPSRLSMKGTFSRRTHGTFRVSSIRNTSRTRPEFGPFNPRVLPHWLRSWQGKPATKSSVPRGNAPTARTSFIRRAPGKCFARTRRADPSISHIASTLWPARRKPSSRPPIPAKRPTTPSTRSGGLSRIVDGLVKLNKCTVCECGGQDHCSSLVSDRIASFELWRWFCVWESEGVAARSSELDTSAAVSVTADG